LKIFARFIILELINKKLIKLNLINSSIKTRIIRKIKFSFDQKLKFSKIKLMTIEKIKAKNPAEKPPSRKRIKPEDFLFNGLELSFKVFYLYFYLSLFDLFFFDNFFGGIFDESLIVQFAV